MAWVRPHILSLARKWGERSSRSLGFHGLGEWMKQEELYFHASVGQVQLRIGAFPDLVPLMGCGLKQVQNLGHYPLACWHQPSGVRIQRPCLES